ncbi:hypothetical protein QEA29_004510 [Salmonella enterica]|nr:hypothetical protein [Salmonella enterica]EKT1326226.1 hypothetical protein [Salmonella enterica]EKT1359332.1 hypothetical protein [Salmonella enterica]EKT2635767.1 hypothetical protein [Salmonella enterica]EKT3224385.1 hypothetical protein [Salmonella enterica]
MFYECAISPEALFEIAISRRNYCDFIKEFSIGGNFLYTELPQLKRNKGRLFGLLNNTHSELQKKRLEDLIIFLKTIKVSRVYDYVGELSWLDNVFTVNSIQRFDYVISSIPYEGLSVSNIDDFFGLNYPRQKNVNRVAESMISIISCLLKTSEYIIIVDPYFSDKPRWWNVLVSLLMVSANGSYKKSVKIDIVFDANKDHSPSVNYLAEKLNRENLAFPEGFTVTVKFKSLASREGNERLHNRYVISNLAGVGFMHGLDEGEGTDDISILSEEVYNKRWEHYTTNNVFDLIDECEVVY